MCGAVAGWQGGDKGGRRQPIHQPERRTSPSIACHTSALSPLLAPSLPPLFGLTHASSTHSLPHSHLCLPPIRPSSSVLSILLQTPSHVSLLFFSLSLPPALDPHTPFLSHSCLAFFTCSLYRCIFFFSFHLPHYFSSIFVHVFSYLFLFFLPVNVQFFLLPSFSRATRSFSFFSFTFLYVFLSSTLI